MCILGAAMHPALGTAATCISIYQEQGVVVNVVRIDDK